MKAAALLLLVLLLPLATAANDVQLQVFNNFQYRSDQDIVVGFQTQLFRNNIPQEDTLSVKVTTKTGTPFPVEDAAGLQRGVRPFPVTNYLNFGELEPGTYDLVVHASAGGASYTNAFRVKVVPPPVAYTADVKGGRDAVLLFEPHDPDPSKVFTITVERPALGVVETYKEWNRSELDVPYFPFEGVNVKVVDPNGWPNYDNKKTDWETGVITYPAIFHFPDQDKSEQGQKARLWKGLVIVAALGVVGTALLVSSRKGWI
ncbi:MAG: hypothetical protein ACPHK8_03845 [Thermoplasmatota archaeon]